MSLVANDQAIKLALQLRPKLILLPLDRAGIDAAVASIGAICRRPAATRSSPAHPPLTTTA